MKPILNRIKILPILILSTLIFSCSKQSTVQKNKQLAQDYYKLCMLEFTDKPETKYSPDEAYKRALQHIQKAIDLNPTAEYIATKATLLFRLSDLDSSKKAFELALKLDSEPHIKAGIMNNYGCLLSQMKKYDEAIQIFDKLETDNAYLTPQAAIFNKGKIFLDQAKYKCASNEFLKALQKAPDFLDARYYLALSAFRLNNLSLAKNEVRTILFLDPDHEGALMLKKELDLL